LYKTLHKKLKIYHALLVWYILLCACMINIYWTADTYGTWYVWRVWRHQRGNQNSMEYVCHKCDGYVPLGRKHFPILSSFMTYHRVSDIFYYAHAWLIYIGQQIHMGHDMYEEFEDTKGVIRIRTSKNRQHNDQEKKYRRITPLVSSNSTIW
jgi:hypothetical protein